MQDILASTYPFLTFENFKLAAFVFVGIVMAKIALD